MTAIIGVIEHVARFREHIDTRLDRYVDGAFLGEEIEFFPIFPCLEWFAIDVGRETDAEALIEVESDDHHLRPAGKVGAVFPKRSVGRVVLRANFERLDRAMLLGPRGFQRLFCAPMSYSHRMNKPAPWRTLHSDYVVDTPFLRLRRDRIQLPDGTIIEDYYVRESHGFTIVFAMTPDDRVVLVHQYKHGIGEYVLELPAGAIDPNEDPLVCAERELAEETGYVSDKPLELVRTFITDPTNSDSRFHLFLARDCEVRVAQEFDATEDIRVELVTLPELRVMVRDGRINVNSHVASIYTVLDSLPADG